MNAVRAAALIVLGLVAACGDRPTLTLRYAPPVGPAHRYALEQEVDTRTEGDSFPAEVQQTLGIRIAFTQTVHGPVEDGTEVRLRVDSVALSSPQIPREALARAGAILHGLVTAIVFNQRMQAVRSFVADPGGASPRDAAMISSSLRGASLPLPEGPVRVGEEWTVTMPAPTGQLPGLRDPIMLTSRLHIKSFDVDGTDTVVRIAFETTFPEDPVPIAFDAEGATLQIKGALRGEQVYSTSRQALVSSTMSGTVRTTTKGEGVGHNVVTVEQRLDLRLRPPTACDAVKLAHLADLHLGYRHLERQTNRGGNQREADVAEAFRRAVDDVLEQRPDLIILAGDIFHSVRPTNPAILFLFKKLADLREGLPDAKVILLAGNHDTPRSSETGSILKLYEALGVEVVADQARRVLLPKLDCAVLAVPYQAMVSAERPAFRPERGVTRNILAFHGSVEGVAGLEPASEYAGPPVPRGELALAQWDYVALGHYHVAHEVAANAWYSGSLEYTSHDPWGELAAERASGLPGKGYLLVDVPGARVTFRPVPPPRRFVDLPPLDATGLTAAELDARIAQRVHDAAPAIDEQVVRLVVTNIPRAIAADLDHATIRGYKARALNFNLDLRRPDTRREAGNAAPGKRQPLRETLREFLGRRPLDSALDRETFVTLGMKYLDEAERVESGS